MSGGDPAAIPSLSYEQYVKIYRRHYRPDNCCITLYGRMDMADKLAFLDEHYLSRMPKGAPRPRTPLQYPQAGTRRVVAYDTDTPETVPVQCALGWYTGRFEELEKQTAVSLLLDALLSTNQSPLKKYLLEQNLGTDIEAGFDSSVQQPVLELLLKGTDQERAARFAGAVREGVAKICAEGIPDEMLTASINAWNSRSPSGRAACPTVCWPPSRRPPAGFTPATPWPTCGPRKFSPSCAARWAPTGTPSCWVSCWAPTRWKWCWCPRSPGMRKPPRPGRRASFSWTTP